MVGLRGIWEAVKVLHLYAKLMQQELQHHVRHPNLVDRNQQNLPKNFGVNSVSNLEGVACDS